MKKITSGLPAHTGLPTRMGTGITLRFLTNTLLLLLSANTCFAQFTSSTYSKAEYRIENAKAAEKELEANPKAMTGLTVDDNYSVQTLIEEIFIAGGCFDVANISYSGDAEAKGRFSNGGSSIGIDDGIILSTGRLVNALGPNTSNARSTGHNDLCNDPSLLTLVNGATNKIYDCATIEFDFTPTTDMVSFEYAFASEEYCEFAGDEYNDVFGFFISGPGISGDFANNSKNLALLPGTNDNVSINSINHFTNSNYYVPNERQFNALSCGKPFEAVALDDIEYDGFTEVLTATTAVIPCETYHIRLIIGDGGDAIYDSAVFLKANSFNAGGTASALAVSAVTGSNLVYESCNDGEFVFQRTSDDLDDPIVINFTINPNSTASEGLDYEALPTSITIPAGQMEYVLPVNILADELEEGQEKIIIQIDNACSCTIQDTELLITEAPSIPLVENNFNLCENEPLSINPVVSSEMPLTYVWSDGSNGEIFETTATVSDVYSVTITDQCGQTIEGNYPVNVTTAPAANLGGTVALCTANETGFLTVELEGTGPWNLLYSIDGTPQNPITVMDASYELAVTQAGIYSLESVQSNACFGEAKGTAIVQQSDMELSFTTQIANCFNDGLGGIELLVEGTTGTYTYAWDANFGNIANPSLIAPDTYQVTVTDNLGCTQTEAITVANNMIYPEGEITTPDEINCSNTTIQINGSVFSSETNTINWSTPDGNIVSGAASLSPTVDQAGTYDFVITNTDNGCTTELSTTVTENIVLPQAAVTAMGELTCVDLSTELNIEMLGAGNMTFDWTASSGIVSGGNTTNPTVNQPGMYQVVITNLDNQCSKTSTVEVTQNIDAPALALSQPEELTCMTTEVLLEATIASEYTIFSEWLNTEGTVLENSQNNTIFPVSEAGIYTLVVTNQENGCSAQDQLTVIENTNYPTLLQTESVQPACKGDVGSLEITSVEGGEAPYLFSIDGGASFFSESGFQNVPAGAYDLMVQDVNGCELESNFVLPDGSEPSLGLQPEVELRLGENHQILPQLNIAEEQLDSIAWSPALGLSCADCLEPMASPIDNSHYTLTIVDENGCSAQADIQFRVEVEENIYIPNAFSPYNEDGINDVFQLYAQENLVSEIVTMRIYDRWGNALYQANNFEPNGREGWNGRFKDKAMKSGVYIYYFEVKLINDTVLNYSGDVTLIN